MPIYIGADHRGFQLKEYLKKTLKDRGDEVVDVGNDHYDENDDYPDFAQKAAAEVLKNPEANRGIVICRSGAGVAMAANRFKGIRAALALNAEQAVLTKEDDDSNVLALAAGFLTEEEAKEIVFKWLAAEFSKGENHLRRIKKMDFEG